MKLSEVKKYYGDIQDILDDIVERHHDVKRLVCVKEQLIKLYEDHFIPNDPDYRSGNETYGYDGDESIQNIIQYIYGKWQCSFRVQWLIDLVCKDYVLYGDLK